MPGLAGGWPSHQDASAPQTRGAPPRSWTPPWFGRLHPQEGGHKHAFHPKSCYRRLHAGINDRRDSKAAIQRTNRRDLRQVGGTDERDPRIAALARRLKGGHAVGLGPPEQGERIRHEFEGEPRLLGKTARRQVVDIAAGWSLTNLDQPFLNATPEVGVGKPKRDAEF